MESAKKMRNLKLFTAAIIIALVSLTSSSAYAFGGKPGQGGGKGHHGHGNVGAPLDGGILTLLIGGAGAAYLAVRKKKKE